MGVLQSEGEREGFADGVAWAGGDAGDERAGGGGEVEIGFCAHGFADFDLREERSAFVWLPPLLRSGAASWRDKVGVVEVFGAEAEDDALADVIRGAGGERGI